MRAGAQTVRRVPSAVLGRLAQVRGRAAEHWVLVGAAEASVHYAEHEPRPWAPEDGDVPLVAG